ncbi:MAG: hypothetical protein A3H02_02435 [Candidatus Niyogibacteria bacterium RIFCSPLOWO2_12_FULL_41_13]|uniref:S1 motif domain-containing protein n=1 Tax=Candidatus Niyogibacteria bacterium RIFCSPLOWO2_12_FULL_41_13 TaxID=1801726 RepID=A0A1G2F0K4_9BACT|nr:MAG: hypothetical protein A3H02_02435 [Candidatus Niyogibacteria bacterium RIFCSPLOWO2_12_FULL_41_13]
MNYLLKKYPLSVLKQGDVLEGKVLSMEKSRLFVDLGEFGIGAIYGAELMKAKNLVNKLKTEDKIYVKVLVVENEDQYVELSPKNAGLETAWEKAEDFMKKQTPVELRAEDANKGGLILNFNELQGFLPTSQLKSEHYPKIESGDKDKILEALKKLVGETFKVTIIDADKDQEKLIFSEKELNSEEINEKISKYKIGEEIEGEVSGTANFGIFVKIEPGIEALSHISELSWGLVENPASLFKVGQKIKAKIIQIENGKIFLSIKAMEPDPWGEMEKKYKEGDIIAGVVSKLEKYGALINVEQGGIAGLLPKTEKKLELGKNYSFNIESLEPKKQKLILKLNG